MATSSIDPTPRVRPTKLIYAVDEWPPPLQLALLGAQYAVMSAIYLVLVAIVLRSAKVAEADTVGLMGIACIALAVGTFLQALPRGPVGSGFLAPPVYSATYLAPSVLAAQVGGMPLVFGMTIIAGLVEIAIALCLTRLRIVITPVISGLAGFIVGLQLGIVGIGQLLDVPHAHQPGFPFHLVVAAVTLVVSIALSIWGRGSLKLICSLCGLIVGMVGAILVGLIAPGDLATFQRAAWFDCRGRSSALNSMSPCCPPSGGRHRRRGARGRHRHHVPAPERRCVGAAGHGEHPQGRAGRRLGQCLRRRRRRAGHDRGTEPGRHPQRHRRDQPGDRLRRGRHPARHRLHAQARGLLPARAAGGRRPAAGVHVLLHVDRRHGAHVVAGRRHGAIDVIGISSLLALSVNVYPHYFHKDAPLVLQSFISNPLAFGLATAIILTLLFRIGTRQHATMMWDAAGSGAD